MGFSYKYSPPAHITEAEIISSIREVTDYKNKDNISRTAAYTDYFDTYPEIKWSFLASMVSRNAGWNMCDLKGSWLPRVLSKEYTQLLFITYERANWLIFDDAFPQLLLYHYSTKLGRPLFHLCRKFNISEFIENEWLSFWLHNDVERLTNALIINEQNVIQQPVIEHDIYKSEVFKSFAFLIQDWFHFSTVLLPTLNGKLYGLSACKFRKLDARIKMGKILTAILFSKPLFPEFYLFSQTTAHTGSRHDYEKYFPYKKTRETPFLRTVYPIINHKRSKVVCWDKKRTIKKKWFHPLPNYPHSELTRWYKGKQKQLEAGILIKSLLTKDDS